MSVFDGCLIAEELARGCAGINGFMVTNIAVSIFVWHFSYFETWKNRTIFHITGFFFFLKLIRLANRQYTTVSNKLDYKEYSSSKN